MAVTGDRRPDRSPPPAQDPGQAPAPGASAAIRPPEDVAARFRAAGWWRDETFLHDLYRTAALDPERPAIVAHRRHRAAGHRTVTIGYGRLAHTVDRFAAALRSLGLAEGDPVAVQLPSRWETAALVLACLRAGTPAVPVLPAVRAHGLERILAASRARVCVVPDRWEGFEHAEALAEMAPRLPWLRQRVVLGDAAATGALDFHGYFRRVPHERGRHGEGLGADAGRADRIGLMVTVMGLGDRYATTLHTPNTLYANIVPRRPAAGPGPERGEVIYSSLPLTSLASLLFTVYWPVALGGTAVFQDVWDPNTCLDLMAEAGVTLAYAGPDHWSEVLSAQRERPRPLESLNLALSGGRTRTSAPLLAELPTALGAPVHAVWGSPEVGLGTVARGETPAERAGESDGRPLPGLELSVLPGAACPAGAREPAPLLVRGPSVAVAVWRHGDPAPVVPWEQDGWLDTGDLGRADGLGGVEVLARAGERAGAIFMVPTAEVEEALLTHPRVAEAAVVDYLHQEHGELPCAVVVPTTEAEPPGLVELREHLAARGVGAGFLPTRLELARALPRDDRGDVRKEALRSWLTTLRPGTPRTL